jgi:hypothetical protein
MSAQKLSEKWGQPAVARFAKLIKDANIKIEQ